MLTRFLQWLEWLLSDDDADEKILHLIDRNDAKDFTGFRIHQETRLPFHQIYPSLNRLERKGRLGSRLERDEESQLRRRHYFSVSPYWRVHQSEKSDRL